MDSKHARRYPTTPSTLAAALLAVAGCAGPADRHEHGPGGHTHAHADAPGRHHVHHLGADAAATPEELAKVMDEMARAADAFLAALTPEQRKKAVYEMTDDERLNWHFVPKPRNGLPLKEMTAEQRPLAHAFLKTALSRRGYDDATGIIDLENVLRAIEGRPEVRDPELYYFTVFGKPDPKGTWGWRMEGHHLSLNFTIVEGRPAAADPSFLGANPGKVLQGPKQGTRVLAEEEDMGRALVKSLSAEQQKEAVISDQAPDEVVTGANRKAEIGEPKGLAFSKMTDPQKEALSSLIEFYAHRLREELAERDLAEIKEAGHDAIRFAWAGGLELGQRHYYRVHGPTFLIEYDNTQNDANHVHTVWRDLRNDFGGDLLREHYDGHKGNKSHGHDDKDPAK